jgi:hypothetical protein
MSDGMTPREEADWLDKFHPSQRALASRQLREHREKREQQRQQQRIDSMLQTISEQGAARAVDYDTTRSLLAELEWRRQQMGDPPHGQHDFQRPGSGLERRCVRCGVRYSEWFGSVSCLGEETTP